MVYLEFLRVRRTFMWYALALCGMVLLVLVGVLAAHGPGGGANIVIDADDSSVHKAVAHHHSIDTLTPFTVPMSGLLATAAFCALGFATALAASFNRETQYAHFTFLRPLSRVRMAMLIASVDVAAIVAAAVFALAMIVLGLSGSVGPKAHYAWDAGTPAIAALGFGSAFMWYAIMQAASAWPSGQGGIYVGITAATLGLAIPLSQAPILGPIAALCGLLLYIDPLAYFTSVTISGSDVSIRGVLTYALELRAALVWLIGLAALALATFLWKRVEV